VGEHASSESAEMKTFECSKETPWGIHLSLVGEHCPRCGWEAPKPKSRSADEPDFGWMPLGAMLRSASPA
jgi:hypothetical protein